MDCPHSHFQSAFHGNWAWSVLQTPHQDNDLLGRNPLVGHLQQHGYARHPAPSGPDYQDDPFGTVLSEPGLATEALQNWRVSPMV